MSGDGASVAPAQRLAPVGVTVSAATDATKFDAGMVLRRRPVSRGIVAAANEGRARFQRGLTCALRVPINHIETVLFRAISLGPRCDCQGRCGAGSARQPTGERQRARLPNSATAWVACPELLLLSRSPMRRADLPREGGHGETAVAPLGR